MKKLILILTIVVLSLSLVACNSSEVDSTDENQETKTELIKLKVGATAIPHAEILEEIKPLLKEQGIDLEIIVYQDYVQPNIQLAEGELDANYFQHIPYFESFTKERGINNLTNIVKVHLEPIGIYSSKIDDLSKLKDGAYVAIPNDPSNMGRSLALLEKAGLIKLEEGVGIKGTINDIVENPKNLEIILLDAAMLPRSLDDVDISVINTNYALQANLNPVNDSLFIEGSDSPYANVLTIRTEDKEKESIKKLAEILNSDTVKQFIEQKYNGAILPAF
ncbi:methionine ABC transporter substrate-binding protein [Vulcanibacillus modesticaldus]|uniref:Lipoprotein n=1 Tax=Vulcanibacillus modesticaldus TaxID=337097 RepID=A0A1D2YUS3_9BACI|nr:MetQ/NlpA family ABC transporter substrate-binding protein [Vulcanibacillus modesticaldus]OEF99405.1 methionine ABC transporter substrate-binding protein [Vulcanibacillus modesticaldus]